MSNNTRYDQCPVCNGRKIEFRLTAKDHTVTNEMFEVWECGDCTARFTQDIPVADQIGRYYQSAEYISHSNTKHGIINRLYHLVRSLTLLSKRNLVRKFTDLETGNMLEVGAGTGAFVHTMQKTGWNVKGLEPDETARRNAKEQFGTDLETPTVLHDEPSLHYDAITLWHVLEHVHELHGYLDTFQRILKEKGTLFIAVPNYTSYDAGIYNEHWAAYDVPRHLYHFSPHSIDILAEQHGMQVIAHKRMWFDSFYVSMLSERYKNGYNNILTAFWNGWLSNWEAFDDASKCSSVVYVIRKK
jgi:2-polyprenyl-3-methyl-5-hydroxy-6-metoxy-1,4-benzoquinol methylase